MFEKGRVPFTLHVLLIPICGRKKGTREEARRRPIPGRERIREEVSQLNSYGIQTDHPRRTLNLSTLSGMQRITHFQTACTEKSQMSSIHLV
jgi:hypothetical protein